MMRSVYLSFQETQQLPAIRALDPDPQAVPLLGLLRTRSSRCLLGNVVLSAALARQGALELQRGYQTMGSNPETPGTKERPKVVFYSKTWVRITSGRKQLQWDKGRNQEGK
ncbi:hypothetical protein NN561_000488 [Cricetulus griseus]